MPMPPTKTTAPKEKTMPDSFLSDLSYTPLGDGRRHRINKAFEYYVGYKWSDDVIIVPDGFITDFASVPRIVWSIYPPIGKYTKAAIVHDFLYWEQQRSRKECDLIMHEAMRVSGCSWYTCQVFYDAVRIGGWVAFNRHARAAKARA